MSRTAFTLVIVWAALIALLATTVAATFAPLGPFKPFLNVAIAAAKASLIVWFFMHLRDEPPLMRVFALGVTVWLFVMFALIAADVLARRSDLAAKDHAAFAPPSTGGPRNTTLVPGVSASAALIASSRSFAMKEDWEREGGWRFRRPLAGFFSV